MIEITSREQAIEELGKLGARQWDGGCGPFLDYEFIYIQPLEPLTDGELVDVFHGHVGRYDESLRAVVNANDARNAEIEKANPKPIEWRTDKAPDEWVVASYGAGRPIVARGSNLHPNRKWHPLPPLE